MPFRVLEQPNSNSLGATTTLYSTIRLGIALRKSRNVVLVKRDSKRLQMGVRMQRANVVVEQFEAFLARMKALVCTMGIT